MVFTKKKKQPSYARLRQRPLRGLGHTQNDLWSVGQSRWYGRDLKTTLKSITLKFWENLSKTQRRRRDFLTIWGCFKAENTFKMHSGLSQECVFCVKAPSKSSKIFRLRQANQKHLLPTILDPHPPQHLLPVKLGPVCGQNETVCLERRSFKVMCYAFDAKIT